MQIHLAVLLFGLTAILGDLISLSAITLVWWRVVITSISFLFFVQFGRAILKLPRKTILIFLGIGVLVAFHWLCFYGSIKYANASVALVAMSTTTFFTSFIEPALDRRRPERFNVLIAMAIIPGMALVVSNLDLGMIKGLLVGFLAALLASIFSILTKRCMALANSFEISFLEIFGACITISLIMPFFYIENPEAQFLPTQTDWIYLLVLSLLCTTLAYYLGVVALKYISAYESNLVVNLEPVYGIILAILILNEHHELSSNFYLGVGIILILVFSYPFLKRKFANESLS